MAITICPLNEADIPAFVRVELEAFKPHPRIPMMWPRGYTDDLYDFYKQRKTDSFHDVTGRFMKAVDIETNQILAVSEWTFSLDPVAEAQKKPADPNEGPPAKWPEGGNWELRCFFKTEWEKWRQEVLASKPYICVCTQHCRVVTLLTKRRIVLDILVTDPEHQRRGAGAKLLSWGCEQADSMGVTMCLESTPAGLSLYESFAFKTMRTIKADMRLFGWNGPYDEEAARRIWMLREPQQQPQATSLSYQ